MKSKVTHALAALLAGTGMALGQGPGQTTSTTTAVRPGAVLPEAMSGMVAPTMAGSPYAGAASGVALLGAADAPAGHGGHGHAGAACGPTGCGPDLCGVRGLYSPGSRVWGGVEYLLWWTRDGDLPVLAGTAPGSLATVSPLPPGAINPGFGGPDHPLDLSERSGVRVTAGFWLDPDQQVGVEGNYWQLERSSINYNAASGGNPILGPVFFDPISNQNVLIGLASPNRLSGTVAAQAGNRLWGFEGNARFRTVSVFSERCDLLLGVRHVQFDEGLSVYSTGTFLPTVPVLGGTRLAAYDSIGVHNRFYAVQAGVTSDFRYGSWFLNFTGKVALGVMNESVAIQGSSSSTLASGIVTRFPGGVLGQPTNSGRQTSDKFAVMPEITINAGYQITEQVRAFVGYNFFWITNVARAGDQIDGVDSRGIPILAAFDPSVSPSRPYQPFNTTHFWAQGINLGVELRY